MIVYSDPDYIETKSILMGQLNCSVRIKTLIQLIENKHNKKVLHVYEDFLETTNSQRLTVVLQEYSDVDFFRDDVGNYDEEIQSWISDKYKEINSDSKEWYFVCFVAFNPVARWEIIDQLPNKFLSNLGSIFRKEEFWMIKKSWYSLIVFLKNDSQVKTYTNSEEIQVLKNEIYSSIEVLDWNNFFSDKSDLVLLDSKENFDKNYGSDWRHYFD